MAAGFLTGILYASLFILQYKMLFKTHAVNRYSVAGMTLVRFALLALCFYSVLHLLTTNFILVLISFACTVWITLLWAKIYPHARS